MKCPHCGNEIGQELALVEPNLPAISQPKANEVIKLWCDLYKKRYGVVYAMDRKSAGILAKKAKEWSMDRFNLLFSCYLAIGDRFYVEQRHPLSLFFRDLQKINVAAQTGKNPATAGVDGLMDRLRGIND